MTLTHRVFIAINLPQEVKNEIAKVLLSLKRKLKRTSSFVDSSTDKSIKWVKEDGFHITLHFLGSLTDEQIKKILEMLEIGIPKYVKTWLKLGKIGFFPPSPEDYGIASSKFRPRIVFVEAVDSGDIERMQVEIGEELKKMGFKVDLRPWHPHITLGRIKGPINIEIFKKQKVAPLKFEVKSIELMESDLRQDGAVYKVLGSFNLR